MEEITVEKVKKYLPTNLHTAISDDLVNKLNALNQDSPLIAEEIKNNFINFIDIMQDGKYKLSDYFNAIKYVSHKLSGKTNIDAYKATFPDRYQRMVEVGIPEKDINSAISAYNRNKLVNKIYEQTIIPSWILNQDAYQEAINTQVELMKTAKSERVRAMAADSILTHLKRPDVINQAQLNINIGNTSMLDDIQRNLVELAKAQREAIKNGTAAKEVAEQRIIIDVQTEEDS